MRILAIDSATQMCGVAVLEDGHALVELRMSQGQTHAKSLLEGIRRVLEMAGLDMKRLDALAVTQGPGSFTGLRIGISTAKGLSLATGKPLVGISALAALASQAPEGAAWVCPMIDARRSQIYWSLYHRQGPDLIQILPEQVGAPLDVIHHLDGPCLCIGNGADAYEALLRQHLPFGMLGAGPGLNAISPAAVARLAWQRLKQGTREDVHRFAPVYLRKSDAQVGDPVKA
jgi:tRNA threonylcarbamoyladenosine biosynthesis protein TsaB